MPHPSPPVVWEVDSAGWGGNRLSVLLAEGWEPFAAISGGDIYLRRQAQPAAAAADSRELPPPSRVAQARQRRPVPA